jgi:hypothetical protein
MKAKFKVHMLRRGNERSLVTTRIGKGGAKRISATSRD